MTDDDTALMQQDGATGDLFAFCPDCVEAVETFDHYAAELEDRETLAAEYALECAAASASYGRDDYYSGDTDNDYSGDY
jgi:hypothetical protein